MNNLKFSLACLLAAVLLLLAVCSSGCTASLQKAEASAPLSESSPEEAAALSRERDLLYPYLPDPQSDEPITREQLCGMALQYVAAQRSVPYSALLDMTELYLADADENGLLICPYTDCGIDHYDNVWRVTALAHTLGLTDTDGKTFLFDLTIPEDTLDRMTQEEISEAGTYHVTVDALTGDCTTERETSSP